MSITNRKAHFDYEILDTFEAGIALTGEEVKAVREGQMTLTGSYVTEKKGGLVLFAATIHRYKHSGNKEYDPKRDRALLLHAREIAKIRQAMQTKGLTVVPLEGYFKGNLFKLKIGIGRGKKEYDKRETIKRRELDREAAKRIPRI